MVAILMNCWILFAQGPDSSLRETRFSDGIGYHRDDYTWVPRPDTPFDHLFDEPEPLMITLEFNVKQFQRNRSRDSYQDAVLTCTSGDSAVFIHTVRIKARGTFRNKYCYLPPFWLNIRKADIHAESLEDVKRMKIVTHCRKSALFTQYIMKEYLVYKLYNIISPYSFRVRLVRVRYIDSGRNNKSTDTWAFIIEPLEMLCSRLNAVEVDNDRLSMRCMNREAMDLLAFFQYMIGNGDYSITGRQNLKIIRLNDPGPVGYLPVPYDFDYTGLVNTHYAVPGPDLGIRSVRERYYLGLCRGEVLYRNAMNQLESCRDEIMETILSFEYLEDDQKMEMVSYIQEYFNEADSDRFIRNHIESTCR